MGFFTIVAWIVLVSCILSLIANIAEYVSYKKAGLGEYWLGKLEPRPSFFYALVLSTSWLGWRYFGG